MEDFIHTAYWAPTMTTVDDPELEVIETDNGRTWTIDFYVGNTHIDCINMEHLNGAEIHNDVKDLEVYDPEFNYLGTVLERLKYAYKLTY
jgi:hypothetical protein